MIIETDSKFVDFGKYCVNCKHYGKPDYKEPCNECLEHPATSNSEVPVKFEVKE